MPVCCVVTVYLTLVMDRRSGITEMGRRVRGTKGRVQRRRGKVHGGGGGTFRTDFPLSAGWLAIAVA